MLIFLLHANESYPHSITSFIKAKVELGYNHVKHVLTRKSEYMEKRQESVNANLDPITVNVINGLTGVFKGFSAAVFFSSTFTSSAPVSLPLAAVVAYGLFPNHTLKKLLALLPGDYALSLFCTHMLASNLIFSVLLTSLTISQGRVPVEWIQLLAAKVVEKGFETIKDGKFVPYYKDKLIGEWVWVLSRAAGEIWNAVNLLAYVNHVNSSGDIVPMPEQTFDLSILNQKLLTNVKSYYTWLEKSTDLVNLCDYSHQSLVPFAGAASVFVPKDTLFLLTTFILIQPGKTTKTKSIAGTSTPTNNKSALLKTRQSTTKIVQNDAPKLAYNAEYKASQLPEAKVTKDFKVVLKMSDFFYDTNINDTLSYFAENLPGWLNFRATNDSDSYEFYGKPERSELVRLESEKIEIVDLIAKDQQGATAKIKLMFKVSGASAGLIAANVGAFTLIGCLVTGCCYYKKRVPINNCLFKLSHRTPTKTINFGTTLTLETPIDNFGAIYAYKKTCGFIRPIPFPNFLKYDRERDGTIFLWLECSPRQQLNYLIRVIDNGGFIKEHFNLVIESRANQSVNSTVPTEAVQFVEDDYISTQMPGDERSNLVRHTGMLPLDEIGYDESVESVYYSLPQFKNSIKFNEHKFQCHRRADGCIYAPPHRPNAQQCVLQDDGYIIDRRERIKTPEAWPYCLHGQIDMQFPNGSKGHGSGMLIGPHHFLTCAHNVYNDGKWAKELDIFFALNEDAFEAHVRAIGFYVYKKWITHADKNYDIALIILNESIGDKIGYAGLLYKPAKTLAGSKIEITGYPFDKDPKVEQMWTMSKVLDSDLDKERLFYKIDTGPAQSGGAIWIKEMNLPMVVGVHTNAAMSYLGYNSGTRISLDKFYRIVQEWMRETGEVQHNEIPGAEISTSSWQ